MSEKRKPTILQQIEAGRRATQQKLASAQEGEKRLLTQLDTAHDENKRLQERVKELETALGKIITSSDCKEYPDGCEFCLLRPDECCELIARAALKEK
jgi:hypothetical protein